MSAEGFQLIDYSRIDDSIIKRDFIKKYHQQGAEVNENQKIKFYFGENLNCVQIGNGYLEIDREVKKVDEINFTKADQIRLFNNGIAYLFQEARLSTSSGTEIENNKYLGAVSTIMRLLTQKDGDLSSYFDKIDEREAGITNSSLKHMLIDSHNIEDKKRIGAEFLLEHIFGFCKTFKKITKGLGFELQLKTSNEKQDIIHTTLGGNAVNVTINSLYLYIPSLVPSPEQQQCFDESIRQSFTLSFDSWVTARKSVNTGNEYQLDIGSASSINVHLYLIAAHQKTQRETPAKPPNQLNNAIFDTNNDVKRYFVEIDGIRYPKDPIETNYSENKHLDHYRDLKLFYKEYNGESLLKPFISDIDLKSFYPIQVIDLRFQVDYITPKKIRIFEEHETDPEHTNLHFILIKHKEIKMVSDGNKTTGIDLI